MDAMKYDDKQFCLPMFAATTLLYYQLDKYEEFGIEGPPETYADLIDIASKVQTHRRCLPLRCAAGPTDPGRQRSWSFNTFFYGEGAKYFEDFPNDMTPTVNSPEAIKALEEFITLKQNYAPQRRG